MPQFVELGAKTRDEPRLVADILNILVVLENSKISAKLLAWLRHPTRTCSEVQ